MIFYTLKGKKRNISTKKYKVNWSENEASQFQTKVKQFLEKYWKYDIVCTEFPVAGTKMRFDIINISKKIIIEVQGPQHTEYSTHFHKYPFKYADQLMRDYNKQEWARMNDYVLVEIFEKDLSELSAEWFKTKYNINL